MDTSDYEKRLEELKGQQMGYQLNIQKTAQEWVEINKKLADPTGLTDEEQKDLSETKAILEQKQMMLKCDLENLIMRIAD